jgi:MFS family permease
MKYQEILPSQEKQPSGFFYGYVILTASFFILMILGGVVSSFGLFLKPVLAEFGWSRATISSAFSLTFILFGISGILAGKVIDRFNPRIPLTIGGLFLGLGYLLMSQVHSVWQIYLFYGVLVSIGIGFIDIPLLSLVVRWFVKGRGLASGIIMSGIGVGTIIFPLLANQFILNYSWRTAYLVLGSASLGIVVILAQFMRRAPGHSPLVDAARTRETDNLNSQAQGLSLREAMRTPSLWVMMMMAFFYAFAAQTVSVHIAAHTTDIGFSSTIAATILSVFGFVSIGGTLGAGILADRIGTRKAMIIVFILIALSLSGFRLFDDLWVLYLCTAFFGVGFGGFGAIQSPLPAEYFGLRAHGVIFSIFTFTQNIGGAIGPLVAGRIYDVSGSYQWAFLLCLILCIAGLILCMLLKPARSKIRAEFKSVIIT